MKIKHTFTLFCLPFTLALFLVSCGTSGDGNGGESFEASDVSAANCADAAALNCFISQWDTTKTADGASYTNTIVLPLVENGEYDFYVDWGDETAIENITEFDAIEVTHTYAEEGEYTIHIAGEIKGWRFFVSEFNEEAGTDNDYGDAVKLLDVSQWGSLSLGNTAGRQFQGAANFNATASDAPDLSETTDLSYAFANASKFNAEIGNWDVENVIDMSFMFSGASSFNNNGMVLDWDDKTSKVTDMEGMFNGASDFNQDISDWDVSQVTTMNSMFKFANKFNNNGMGLDWDDKTSKVTNMEGMFNGASVFNQDISEWDVANVEFYDDFATGSGLITNHTPPKFRGANAVSKEVCEAKPELNCFISVWNTANSGTGASDSTNIVLPLVSEGTYDFYVNWGDGEAVEKIEAYNAHEVTHTYTTPGEYTVHIAGTIKGWRFFVSQTDGVNYYGDAVKLLNVTQWGSLSLGNTDGRQFRGAENFNPTATDAPDVSETTSLHSAFSGASNFNGEIANWDVSKVTDMSRMFLNASSFNNNGKPLDWGTKTSKVTSMKGMFWGASVFNQDIRNWDVSQVTDMTSMFLNASVFNQNISGWNVENVEDYNNFATGSGLELNNIPFKFREIDTISKAICDANPLTNCFISVWNTANSGGGASAKNTIVLPLVSDGTYDFYVDWGDESEVEYITNYSDATHTYSTEDAEGEKTIHIAGTIKGWRFYSSDFDSGDAVKLTDVTQWGSLSLGNTDGRQFYNAENFNPTATDAPDVSETTSLSYAFNSASKFNADISDWDVSKVTSMTYMFHFATSFNNNGMGLDWDDKTSKVTDMEGMFNRASVFNQDISGWNVENVMAYRSFATGSGIANKPNFLPDFKPQ